MNPICMVCHSVDCVRTLLPSDSLFVCISKGPACCNCDGKQTYAPATSSGWLPLFSPDAAAPLFQTLVNTMTASGHPTIKLVSPAMANDADPVTGQTCADDPSGLFQTKTARLCNGWLFVTIFSSLCAQSQVTLRAAKAG